MTLSGCSLLLVTVEQETAELVGSTLQAGAQFASDCVCQTLEDLKLRLPKGQASVVIVDIDPQPDQMLAEIGDFVARFPETSFVALCGDVRNELILKAMKLGVRYFLAKSSIHAELVDVLHRFAPNLSGVERRGAVVTVLSACGGSGATTVAINLADSLQLTSLDPTLVVDLDTHHGAIASGLGLRGQYSIADIMLHHGGHIDPELIRTTAIRYSDRLQVLASPSNAAGWGNTQMDFTNLDHILEACQKAFEYTVIDAPRASLDQALVLASRSIVTLIVFQLNVKDIRQASTMLNAMTQGGAAWDRLIPLANRCEKRSLVSFEDAQRVLGTIPVGRVGNDYRSVTQSLNYGQPLSKVAPRSLLHRQLNKLAEQVIEAHKSDGRVSAPA